MKRSNHVIYPFKIKFEGNFNINTLKTDFGADKIFDNIESIDGRDCSAALEFIKEENSVLFFALNKFDDNNITVSDFTAKKDMPSFLKENQKIKNYSLFALLKDKGMLLLLYNHNGFGYVVPTLHKYLEAKLNINFTAENLTRDYTDKDIQRYCKDIKHVHIIRAREKYRTFEKEQKGRPRKKIKKYMEKTEEIIKLQRIGSLSFKKIYEYIKGHMKEDYDKIIINSKNIGDIDILDKFVIHFPCTISTDEDGLANKEEFEIEILKIKDEEKALFDKY